MIKFLHRLLVGIGAVTIIGTAVAVADYVIKDGAGATQTVLAFTCATTKICPASVPITSAGVEIAVSTAANQATEIASLATIATNTGAAIPAGSAIIGKVGVDQTTPGTTNGVAIVGVNAATALAGNGVTGTGSQRVTIASDNTAFSVNATLGTETTKVIGTVRNVGNVGGVFDAVNGAAYPANTIATGYKVGSNIQPIVGDPCQTNAATWAPISITTATTTRIIAPSTSNRTYVCYMILTSAAADNIGIVEGTGGTCGTGTAGIIGGTTAANGPNFAANGGFSIGNGVSAVAATAGTNVDFCLITSAATPLAGHVKYVQAP